MSILQVAVPGPLRTLLDYSLPEHLTAAPPAPGTRITVPLGRRQLVGVVFGLAASSTLATGRLRAAGEVLDARPLLPADLLTLARWAADYYQHPIGEIAAQMLPIMARRIRANPGRRVAALKRRDDAASGEHPQIAAEDGEQLAEPTDKSSVKNAARSPADKTISRAPAQRRALALLQAAPEGIMTLAALAEAGISGSVARALVQAGRAERIELPAMSGATPGAVVPRPPLPLTDEQRDAARAIDGANAGFRTLLLNGVTGSGKTEVYFAAMRATLDAGRQVLMLVPEIGLTPQTLQRITARFPEPLAVLHSALADGDRLAAFGAAADGRARIVVGTRSAVFAPLAQAGLLIVDEEHDESYKQQDGFRYSARDLAVKRASLLDIPVVLGSATPSLESLANAREGRYRELLLTQRVGGGSMPTLELVNTARHQADDGLSTPLLEVMAEHLGRGEQVLAFINRRGFAPVLMCRGCNWLAECSRCDARLTVHARPGGLRCHHCGSHVPLPPRCPECGDTEPLPVGIGTQRTEQALRQHFPDVPVIRIDRDTTRSARALGERFAAIREDQPAILVGTQMIAKGHHFPMVTLAAVIGADAGFFSADFRASERLAQILVQVAGRAGRAERPGRVLIQTRLPEHELLQTLLKRGYAGFAELALAERHAMGLPPYGRLALIRAEATDASAPDAFLEAAATRLRRDAVGVQVLGPVPALMPRRAGRIRAQLLLQAAERGPLHRLLAGAMPDLDTLPEARRVRWSLDVDPLDTL